MNTGRAVVLAYLAATILAAPAALAQRGEGPLDPGPPKDGLTVEEVIARFTAKEAEFQRAREKYTWRQHARVQAFDADEDRAIGTFESILDQTVDGSGRRVESVVFAPQPSLWMTREDFDQIYRLAPFMLTASELSEHHFGYAGRQRVDELETYVFYVAPRNLAKGKRYFEGRIWVDDQDFQVVKATGKSVPDIRVRSRKRERIDQLFPTTTSWREKVDGQYWFPTYTRADDVLDFGRQRIRVRLTVRYTNYRPAEQQTTSR